MEKQYEKIKEKLIKYNQEQLLVNYKNMNNEDKEKLLKEIDNIDFNLMKNLYKNAQKNLYTQQVENLKRRLGQKKVSRWTENPKGRSRQKLGIKAYDYVPSSHHLPTRRRFVISIDNYKAPHRLG